MARSDSLDQIDEISIDARGSAKWVAVGVLFVAYTMIGVDRGIVAIVIEPIKLEFARPRQGRRSSAFACEIAYLVRQAWHGS